MSMSQAPSIVVYGASGHANAYRHSLTQHGLAHVVAFIDDFRGDQGHCIGDEPIISLETWRAKFPHHACMIAVGDATAKRRIAERVVAAGGTFHSPHRQLGSGHVDVTIGEGSLVGRPTYVGPNTRIGAHVSVMPMSTVGHDVEIGDYCTVCPGVNVGGYVIVGHEVFVGAGAVIVNGSTNRPLIVGNGATIAAGAVVTKSVPPGVTVMGNPARPLREIAAAQADET